MTNLNHNTQPITIAVTLTPDHLSALAAMVELGTEDRRGFLARYAAENDYTDEDIANGHYEADCADDAIDRLRAAVEKARKPESVVPNTFNEDAACASDGWAIYSPNESASNNDRGFWHRELGWQERDAASLFSAEQLDQPDLPDSSGRDARWVHLPLMKATTESELVSLWKQFCAVANLPCVSADELLADEGIVKDRLLVSEHLWISQFVSQWDAVMG